MKYTALIVAAGAGTRMGLGYNKAYYRMEKQTILERSMHLFLEDPDCEEVVVVTDSDTYRKEVSEDGCGRIVLVQGGDTRKESVFFGMQAVISDVVLIHDGARPFLTQENLSAIKQAMETEAAACLMVPCKDTIKLTADGYIEKTLPRSQLMAAQTPQAFQTELLLRAMRSARADGFEATDDCSIVEAYTDIRIKTVPGSYANKKITTIEDLQ